MTSTPPTADAESGFAQDHRYVATDPWLAEQGYSHLINDRMHLQIDPRGRCSARYNQPAPSTYAQDLRSFYIRDERTGRFWSAPFEPVRPELDSFEFSAGRSDIQWRVAKDGIEAHIRLVVPRDDTLELWTVTVTNLGPEARKLSLYPCFPVGLTSWLAQSARYDKRLGGLLVEAFPYYVKAADYPRLKERNNCVFCAGDRQAASAEASHRVFLGRGGAHDPDGLRLCRLTNSEAHMESASAIMQYPLSLAGGASATLNLVLGPAKDRADAMRLSRKYLRPGAIDRALSAVNRHLDSIAPAVRIETPDADLNHFVNAWLPHQTSFCGGLLRLNGEPCVRNAFQDVMGIVYTQPAKARQWYCKVIAHQRSDGFMPHGAPIIEGAGHNAINSIPHRDMNVWAPLTLSYYAAETGDTTIFNEQVGFSDSQAAATVYEHVCLGLDWLLADRTERGLSRLGDGDWDDPLNMAGMGNRGESVWLTEALAAALDAWAPVAAQRDDQARASRYRAEADACRQAVNTLAWQGQWYARGTTDAGRWFGTARDAQGKIWLNPQSWAMICGAADEQRIEQCIRAVERRLMTPSGPMTLAPAFTQMHEDIGKITQKTPGTSENGAVYCHAAAFYAFGLFRARRADKAFAVLRALLTGGPTNTLARSGQLPLYIPNFYRGLACGATAGRTSNLWSTGTAAWFYRTVVGELLGVRGEHNALRIDPQLPSSWKRASLWRRFRGADYDIDMRRSRTVRTLTVKLDGQPLADNLVPLQPAGTRHRVEAILPLTQ